MSSETTPALIQPSAAFQVTVRCILSRAPGALGRLTTAVGSVGGDIEEVRLVFEDRTRVIRDLVILARDAAHQKSIVEFLDTKVPGVKVESACDDTFELHKGGKLSVQGKTALKNPGDLAMAYTPGVARICTAIGQDKELSHLFTIRRNTVAVVSDGTAILGLGDLGPEAAMPVMEGKAQLFKEFGGVDAFPICLATKDPDEIVRIVSMLAPTFGGVNLEDISAPRCFDIESRLQDIGIPVFHDDQHGTAIVMLAALTNALKLTGKRFEDLKVVVSGVGSAGVACSKIMLNAGVKNLIACDTTGAIWDGRTKNMNGMKEWIAKHTNPEKLQGGVTEVIRGADLFVGLSAPGQLTVDHLKSMAKDPIIFAMANPTPEIMPEQAAPWVKVMATGRSDYPNQINNVLAFPGIFRGALDVGAKKITEGMKLAAAAAIAGLVSDAERNAEYIVPSPFDRRVGPAVAQAVSRAAVAEGVANPERKKDLDYDAIRW